jgi:hypothetical protein
MSGESNNERTLREVPVDWEALEDAFENNAPEVHSYLHLDSGEVLRVVDGIADPEMHTRIISDTSYLRIESVSSREQYRWMERFIQMVDTPPLRAALTQAIDGKGAFRRFKDVLMSQATERERWFTFRSERLRVFMEAWLAAHNITPVARPVWEKSPEPGADSKTGHRRVRSTESLRRQLKEIADGLGARDLDKVLTFAEFIKARRIARNQSRTEPSNVDLPAPDEAPDSAQSELLNEVPANEPRKVTLIR